MEVYLGWEMKVSCMSSGLAHLPTVFLAPTQALLMAALYGTEEDQYDDDAEDLSLLRDWLEMIIIIWIRTNLL